MDKIKLQKLLSQPYDIENWKEIVQFVFPNVSILNTPKEFPIHNNKIIRFAQIGSVKLNDGKNLALFELLLAENVNLQRNRVELNNEISKYIDQEQIHGVLSVFDKGAKDYRFTFSARSTEFKEEESDFVSVKTDTKRYTYVLGANESCKTPAKRFFDLSQNKNKADIQDIQDAFSVEKLSKEFFDKYKKQFETFWKYLADNEAYSKLFKEVDPEKQIRDFTKKLLGRIVFLHFLQKKGWMGCNANLDSWQDGDKQFMQHLFENYTDKKAFHSHCLSQLFFDTLNNKERKNFEFSCQGLEGNLNHSKIPYLNGGLFDDGKELSKKIDFPGEYFEDLLQFFGQYNFTIDENDPNDHEVGIDPEMLGHIFENLLEDNKDKGAFYTPKAIVQYMCQESLIEYLATALNCTDNETIKTSLQKLVRERLAEDVNDLDLIAPITQALFNVKICDPAIGSGAFPMGILNEMFSIVEQLFYLQPDVVAPIWHIDNNEWQPHLVKKNIIQNSIYGVDLESGAVDIARLRFWLALIVHEKEPLPLPNLDYKIMQGNSLLESFEGIDLSQINEEAAYETRFTNKQIDIFTGEAKKEVQISLVFEDIQALMNEYFEATKPNEKATLHQRIDNQVRNHIHFKINEHKESLVTEKNKLSKKIKHNQNALSSVEQKMKVQSSSKEAKALAKIEKQLNELENKNTKLAQLSTSNERPFFLWHLFFQDVFQQGGFDIVIGNPPYLSNKGVTDEIKNHFGFKDDLYNYFFLIGDSLLRDKGLFCYITSNTFLTLQSKLNIRELLLKNELLILANLGHDVFESAMVSTAVTIYRKVNKLDNEIRYIDARGKSKLKNASNFLVKKQIFSQAPNKVFFTPNDFNKRVYDKYSQKIKTLIETHWDKISTSRNISKFAKELKNYRNFLKEADITLLGLVSDGGQGLATGNNGKFVGVLEGTKIADRVFESRYKKLSEFNKKYNTSYSLDNKTELEIRDLFDDLKEKYGRDCFGQGYLFRIVGKDEIAEVETLTDDEKQNGIKGSKAFVPYDKGDKDGNRWYLKTPYYIDWSFGKVKDLKTRSGLNGKGKSLWQNPQFYFQEGFCWSDIHTVLIKSRLKSKSVHDVVSMSLFPLLENITPKYVVCLINSKFASLYSHEFLNNTSHFQINDARQLPLIVPNKTQLNEFEKLFDKAYNIQEQKFDKKITKESAEALHKEIQIELDTMVENLYF